MIKLMERNIAEAHGFYIQIHGSKPRNEIAEVSSRHYPFGKINICRGTVFPKRLVILSPASGSGIKNASNKV